MAVSTEERRIVTVLFADMAGSTALGEELDPEEMRHLLGGYYAIARECVEQHGGTVEKFIGDAVMAVFGLPTAHGDDPDRAIAAALAMRERIRADEQLHGRIAIRFGLSTGEVVASRDQTAGDFLITGDATNVAARLQQAAEPWAILVSERTVRAAVNYEFGVEIEVTAKGKAAPVVAREVHGLRQAKAHRRVRLPLIGRENELEQLQLVARRAITAKRPAMASLIAPAGTGKTRLVEEFLDWLPSLAPDAQVATAQCLPYGQRLTYWPMRQVLFAISGVSEDTRDVDLREGLASWLQTLGVEEADRDAKLLAATIGEAGMEGVDRDMLFGAWRIALESAARRSPLVIVFEDLHWSSDSLLDLAEFVMQPRGDSAVLMIVLARPELLDRRPNWGGGRLNHLAIALEPLRETAIADLVRYMLDTDAPDVIKLVSDRSEGNPFYAGELVRAYLEQGSLQRLPDTVRATVLGRLDLLPHEERRMLQLGSVFGRAFRAAGIAALENRAETQVRRLCEDLADRDLIRPGEGDRFNFRHILIQEVAYNTLPRSERARLHAAAARWVESTSQGREVAVAEILAFHYREAAVLSVALDPNSETTAAIKASAAQWLLKASEVAAAAGATVEAVRHARAAFDYVDVTILPRLHERIGDLTGGDSGIDEYRTALAAYEEHNAPVDDQLRALAGILMVETRWEGSVGDRPSEEAMNELRGKGRRLAERATDKRAIARFLCADAFYPSWLHMVREPESEVIAEANRTGERAVEFAKELDEPELVSGALDALAAIALVRKDWPSTLKYSFQRLELEERLGLHERLDAHSMVAWMAYLMGDLAAAERDSADMVARLLPGQSPFLALHLYAWRAMTLMMLGRWDEAVAMFWRAVEAWTDAGRIVAGHGQRGFLAGLDIARARGDARVESAAVDTMLSIINRYPASNQTQPLVQLYRMYVSGDPGFTANDRSARTSVPFEFTERRLNLANDKRQPVPDNMMDGLLEDAVLNGTPLLEAQVRRSIGLARGDASELSAAIEIWERIGAVPCIGRARAERGLITGDSAEIEAGLAILKKLGDVSYVDRFSLSP
jgi:class 3 adenylate cyclase/tetratricopeptide (TPR) repeat protein